MQIQIILEFKTCFLRIVSQFDYGVSDKTEDTLMKLRPQCQPV